MSFRLLSALILAGLALAACSGKQVAGPALADSGTDAVVTDASDAAVEAEVDGGLRQYPCTWPQDCDRYFGSSPSCVRGICCLGFDDGKGHCVCGTQDGGCQDPRGGCCAPMLKAPYCTIEYCPEH